VRNRRVRSIVGAHHSNPQPNVAALGVLGCRRGRQRGGSRVRGAGNQSTAVSDPRNHPVIQQAGPSPSGTHLRWCTG
jgi:hypothetical protein